MQIDQWGDSLAVRIPSEVAEDLDLKAGDEITLTTDANGAIVITVPASRHALHEGLRKFRGRLPAGFKFDREEANAR